MSKFFCHGCGLCCTRLDEVLDMKGKSTPSVDAVIDEFPYEPLENGHCPQLQPDMSCGVYEDRPLLCDVDRFGEKVAPHIPKAVHQAMQESGCRDLMRKDGQTEQEINRIYTERVRKG